jgi:ABC-type antimicrobial peptide transport system permease subunit
VAKGASIVDVQIVGVIRSERVAQPGVPDPPVAYAALAQAPQPEINIILRTQADPLSAVPVVREVLRQIDPNLPFGNVATMLEVRERTLAGASRPAWLIGAFAAIAAFLAGLGLYGVLSHSVAQQRREIGIRMALGARSRDVLSHVLRNALVMVSVGLAIGMAGAFALTGTMRTLLFDVSPLDPLALAAACIAMTLIGLLAGFVPASRAARVDPMTTLRDEG